MMDALVAAEEPSDTLAALLGEHDVGHFLEHVWEREPLHVRNSRLADLAGLLTLADLNTLFESSVFRADECKVARGGSIVAASAYIGEPGPRVMQRASGELVNAAALLNCFHQGATLVLSQLNHKWPPLQYLKDGLQRSLAATVIANVFLSNRNSQGFSLHYDSHDVFVVQLHGSKTWSLHDSPIRLPTKAQPFGRTDAVSGPVRHTLTLEAGDVLYVPRGVFHEARTSDAVSLHVTLGVHQYLWLDYISDIVPALASDCVAWRGSVPHGDSPSAQAARRAGLRERLAGLLASDNLDPLAAEIYRQGIAQRTRPGTHLLSGHLEQILSADALSADSVLALRAETPMQATIRDDQVRVTGCGQSLTFTTRYRPMLQAIVARRQIALGELPGECGLEEKLDFARRLIGLGVLVAF